MSTSLRWQRVLAIVAALVMIAAALQPLTAEARPAPAPSTLTGKAQGPVGFAVSQPLSMLAEKMAKTQIDDGATSVEPNAPYVNFLGGMQIPRVTTRSNQFNLPNVDAAKNDPKAKVIDPPAPGLDWQWAGLSQGLNRVWYGYGVYPPDTQGDLGPYHYIQVVNTQMAIWDLWDVSLVGTPKTLYAGPINTLWAASGLTACEDSQDGDPVVVYDEYADRWVMTQFALPDYPNPPFYECIAVSQTGDPMGAWNLYQYSFPVMNDYPKFGVWHDGYYMSINQFTPWQSPAWAGQGVVVFDRDAMLAGTAADMIYIDTYTACVNGDEPECYLGGMLPSDADGLPVPTGNQVFMQFDDDAWGYSPDQLQLWEMVPDWVAGTATFTHLVDLPTNAFDSEVCPGYARNCIPQLGTTVGLDAIADRLMYRLQWRDFGTYQAMVVNHTVDVTNAVPPAKGQAGIRWYELRDTGTGWGIYQQGDIAPDAKNRWMGSAAMDGVGNIAIGYSVSDATIYPGIRYTVHLASDPLGTVRDEVNMVNGGGAQTGTGYRWGDYSMMSVYPEGYFDDGCDFVYTTEYLRGTTPAEWYTWLGWFHNASCYNADVEAPDTTITGTGTAGIASTTAQFTFTSTEAGTFECSFDGSAWATCTSPKNYTGLANGDHHFMVRAKDVSGNIDATPAEYAWTVNVFSASFVSQPARDGFVTESGETTDLGGLVNATGSTINVGDGRTDRQLRGFLSFNTSALPDGAVVVGATIELRAANFVGVDPFSTHGPLLVDINSPAFGGPALTITDFETAADMSNVATCDDTTTDSWYDCDLFDGFAYFNTLGTTQFRIYFTVDDNDNLTADQVKFSSGEATIAAYRPVLVVQYYVPVP